jgi:PAS domain S-box-containing protein
MENDQILKQIFAVALDAVVQIDAKGIVKPWNKQATITFGWSEQEAIGTNITDLIFPETYKKAYLDGIQKYFSTGEGPVLNTRIEICAMRKNGEEFPIDLAITPI